MKKANKNIKRLTEHGMISKVKSMWRCFAESILFCLDHPRNSVACEASDSRES